MRRRRRLPFAVVLVAIAALLLLRFFPSANVAHRASLPGPWTSREACEASLAARSKRGRPDGVVRVVTWNLRWFPDGAPAPGGPHASDVAWLACGLAWLDADVVALQEVKDGPAADAAMGDLLARLSRATGGRWKQITDRCPRDSRQHLSILWDDVRSQVEDAGDLAALNPTGSPCGGRLRPGLRAAVRSRKGGLDFSIVDVHADSGRMARDRGHRTESAHALADAALGDDADVVALGDWNTMGQGDPPETGDEERAALDAALGSRFRRLGGASCSEYWRKRPSLLDHVYVSKEMSEADAASVEVEGFCRRAACEPLHGDAPAAFDRLSDHCPIVADLRDVDDDPEH